MRTDSEDLAGRAWRALSQVALDHDRKAAVSAALDVSWTRVLALRCLAEEPLTQRALAERLVADPPYVTLIIDDLEARGLARRTPHPTDRRAKLATLTPAGRAAAARADAILFEPPAALREVAAEDLEVVLAVLDRLPHPAAAERPGPIAAGSEADPAPGGEHDDLPSTLDRVADDPFRLPAV